MVQVEHPSQGDRKSFLSQIQPRIPVYDVTGTGLGEVARVYDKANAQQPLVGRVPLCQHLDRAPIELANRLRREGYVEVDSGLLSGDYFILLPQIADVTDKGVLLVCHRAELIQL